MIPRRGFMATLAAIACAPLTALKRPIRTTNATYKLAVESIATVDPLGDCGGFIVPEEFTAALVQSFLDGKCVHSVTYPSPM